MNLKEKEELLEKLKELLKENSRIKGFVKCGIWTKTSRNILHFDYNVNGNIISIELIKDDKGQLLIFLNGKGDSNPNSVEKALELVTDELIPKMNSEKEFEALKLETYPITEFRSSVGKIKRGVVLKKIKLDDIDFQTLLRILIEFFELLRRILETFN
jgi:hypothetical protein